MADFTLHIVTAQSTVFDDKVSALTLPGEGGSFGILAHHAPIVSVLKAGPVVIRQGQKEQRVTIESGFLEMSNNVATLLAEGLKGLQAPSKDDDA